MYEEQKGRMQIWNVQVTFVQFLNYQKYLFYAKRQYFMVITQLHAVQIIWPEFIFIYLVFLCYEKKIFIFKSLFI